MNKAALVAVLVLAACGSDKSTEKAPEKPWTEVPYHPPIRSERMLENPFDPKSDPKARAAYQIEQMFDRHGEKPPGHPDHVGTVFDGTTTLFLQIAKCDHEKLARYLQVIGAAKLKQVGFITLACDDVETDSAKAAIEIR